ncbi:hypothetical protein [Nocardioides xinjiangensis]|uniref:hypothetical protein n=1 Tax=Nocardioides xinjiangensis TaxID=2817376 RepID=UPI001B3174E2|nr:MULTISPECIES: hypothetical protein [unclassified Nocardioides]
MTTSDDQSQTPWSDPQTHVDTDPVNAAPQPDDAADTDAGGDSGTGTPTGDATSDADDRTDEQAE